MQQPTLKKLHTLKFFSKSMLLAVCTPAQVQALKESQLKIRGDGDQGIVSSEELSTSPVKQSPLEFTIWTSYFDKRVSWFLCHQRTIDVDYFSPIFYALKRYFSDVNVDKMEESSSTTLMFRLMFHFKMKCVIGKTQKKFVRQVFNQLEMYQVCTDYWNLN